MRENIDHSIIVTKLWLLFIVQKCSQNHPLVRIAKIYITKWNCVTRMWPCHYYQMRCYKSRMTWNKVFLFINHLYPNLEQRANAENKRCEKNHCFDFWVTVIIFGLYREMIKGQFIMMSISGHIIWTHFRVFNLKDCFIFIKRRLTKYATSTLHNFTPFPWQFLTFETTLMWNWWTCPSFARLLNFHCATCYVI